MRFSLRDKRIFWYALYVSKTEKTETISGETVRLGEYEITYTSPGSWIGYVSIPRGLATAQSGNAEIREYGVDTEYRKYMIVEGEGIPSLAVDSVLWLDREPEMDTQTGLPKENGNVPPDYRVTRVAKAWGHTIYEVKEY